MIEMNGISDANRFAYNNYTRKKGDGREAEFTELMRGDSVESTDSRRAPAEYEDKFLEFVTVSDNEMVTYTFNGKISVFGSITGRNLNFEA